MLYVDWNVFFTIHITQSIPEFFYWITYGFEGNYSFKGDLVGANIRTQQSFALAMALTIFYQSHGPKLGVTSYGGPS